MRAITSLAVYGAELVGLALDIVITRLSGCIRYFYISTSGMGYQNLLKSHSVLILLAFE